MRAAIGVALSCIIVALCGCATPVPPTLVRDEPVQAAPATATVAPKGLVWAGVAWRIEGARYATAHTIGGRTATPPPGHAFVLIEITGPPGESFMARILALPLGSGPSTFDGIYLTDASGHRFDTLSATLDGDVTTLAFRVSADSVGPVLSIPGNAPIDLGLGCVEGLTARPPRPGCQRR